MIYCLLPIPFPAIMRYCLKEAYTNLMDPRYGVQNADLAKELSELKKQNIMLKEYPHSSFGIKGNVQILGYFTGTLADGEFRITEMKGVFIVGGSLSYTHNTVVWGIPAYFKVSLAAKIEAGISMKYNKEADVYVPDDEQPMTASVTLSAQAGPGWEGYATLTGKGSGALKSYFSLPIRNSKTMWSISGNISFIGSVGGISGEWKLLKSPEMVFWDDGKAVWYEKGSEEAYTMAFIPDLSRSVMTYANRTNGNAIVTGISGYTSPSMAALPDGRLLAVWTADVPGRSAVDKNGIYYSLCTDGKWSAPQLVWEDGTNDSTPELWTIGNSVWLTWQNYTETYGVDSIDSISYEDIAGQIAIAAAEFDSSSNSFTAQNVPCVTYGYAPQMHLTGNQIELAWMDENGTLWKSAYAETSWENAIQTNVDWYEDEVSLPSTYEGDIPGSNATIQTISTADCQAILYTDIDENGISNVYGLFNDGYGWGIAVPLTDISTGSAGGFSAVITEDMNLQLLVNTIHYDDEGSYQSADLAFYERTLRSDLTVKSADYVHETLTPGGTLTITADVVNNSAQTLSGLTVSLDFGTFRSDNINCAVTLLPGEAKTVYVNQTLPSNFNEEIKVSIYPQNGGDADTAGNDAVCILQMTDISLEEVFAEQMDNETVLTAMVVNRGNRDIRGYTVTYRAESTDGNVIAEEQIDEILAPGEAAYLSTLVNMPLEPGTVIYADVLIANGGAENLYGNNSDLATVPQAFTSNDVYEYTVTVTAQGNGTVYGGGIYVDGEFAKVTAVPNSGEKFLGWYIDNTLVSSDAEYRFLVNKNIEIVARFTENTSPSGPSSTGGSSGGSSKPSIRPSSGTNTQTTPTTPSTPSGIFSDVPSNHTFATEIMWARDSGIMGGYSDGTFRPNNYTNRQQMWMVLARMAGANPANMAEARTWAINAGISDGTNPENVMSRQQLVTMLYRFAQSQGVEISGSADLSAYPDNGTVASYAQEALAWAVGNGIVTGTSDGRLNPEGTATRAHFAAFLYRYSNLAPSAGQDNGEG